MDWTCKRGGLNLPVGLKMEDEIYKAANTFEELHPGFKTEPRKINLACSPQRGEQPRGNYSHEIRRRSDLQALHRIGRCKKAGRVLVRSFLNSLRRPRLGRSDRRGADGLHTGTAWFGICQNVHKPDALLAGRWTERGGRAGRAGSRGRCAGRGEGVRVLLHLQPKQRYDNLEGWKESTEFV